MFVFIALNSLMDWHAGRRHMVIKRTRAAGRRAGTRHYQRYATVAVTLRASPQ